jgi:hypothetical protein
MDAALGENDLSYLLVGFEEGSDHIGELSYGRHRVSSVVAVRMSVRQATGEIDGLARVAPLGNSVAATAFTLYGAYRRSIAGRPSCAATKTSRRPFEPTSKRRRGFPLARPTSSGESGSSARTPNWWRSSAARTRARADPGAGFRRCCRPSGRFDDSNGHYYVRD